MNEEKLLGVYDVKNKILDAKLNAKLNSKFISKINPKLKLYAPSLSDFEIIRRWRNECLQALRTPFMLTQEMQADFYKNVVCNRNSNIRFWSAKNKGNIYGKDFIGLVGLVNICWENRSGEISIILDGEERGKGHGKEAMCLLLKEGFDNLNLDIIYGECYFCNDSLGFWKKLMQDLTNKNKNKSIIENGLIKSEYEIRTAILPDRKFWDGQYWDGWYFSIKRNRNINSV